MKISSHFWGVLWKSALAKGDSDNERSGMLTNYVETEEFI